MFAPATGARQYLALCTLVLTLAVLAYTFKSSALLSGVLGGLFVAIALALRRRIPGTLPWTRRQLAAAVVLPPVLIAVTMK